MADVATLTPFSGEDISVSRRVEAQRTGYKQGQKHAGTPHEGAPTPPTVLCVQILACLPFKDKPLVSERLKGDRNFNTCQIIVANYLSVEVLSGLKIKTPDLEMLVRQTVLIHLLRFATCG